jgi:hypothetical protein
MSDKVRVLQDIVRDIELSMLESEQVEPLRGLHSAARQALAEAEAAEHRAKVDASVREIIASLDPNNMHANSLLRHRRFHSPGAKAVLIAKIGATAYRKGFPW